MKHKLSITVEEDVIMRMREAMRSRHFRNKSHFFEVAATELLKDMEGKYAS